VVHVNKLQVKVKLWIGQHNKVSALDQKNENSPNMSNFYAGKAGRLKSREGYLKHNTTGHGSGILGIFDYYISSTASRSMIVGTEATLRDETI